MHKDRLREMREVLLGNRERFDYSVILSHSTDDTVITGPLDQFNAPVLRELLAKARDCGSTGCVIGFTCMHYMDEVIELYREDPRRNSLAVLARLQLGLNSDQAFFLFFQSCGAADIDDAIARIDWLLADKDINDYWKQTLEQSTRR